MPRKACTISPLNEAIFDLDAAAQRTAITVDCKANMSFTNTPVKTDESLPYWDLSSTVLERTGGGVLTEAVEYTHAYVLKWRASDSGWRTLLRHNQDHCIIVKDGSKDLGMYSNRKGAFRDSGYDVCGTLLPPPPRVLIVMRVFFSN